MDNEDEFLVEISKNILILLKSNSNIDPRTAIPVMTPLAQFQDPIIRKEAIEVLLYISK